MPARLACSTSHLLPEGQIPDQTDVPFPPRAPLSQVTAGALGQRRVQQAMVVLVDGPAYNIKHKGAIALLRRFGPFF